MDISFNCTSCGTHIPPFEFENWAVIALGGIPNKVQVGDMGVDGVAEGQQ